MNTATNETTTFILYKHNAIVEAGVSASQAEAFDHRIHSAFEMGEPVWMIADEIKLRCNAPKKAKTPRELAVRVVRAA